MSMGQRQRPISVRRHTEQSKLARREREGETTGTLTRAEREPLDPTTERSAATFSEAAVRSTLAATALLGCGGAATAAAGLATRVAAANPRTISPAAAAAAIVGGWTRGSR
jgi:hypothetical protein